MTRPSRALREQIHTRDRHCVRCGGPADNIHHRRPRAMGGTRRPDTAANLVLLCGSGVTGCHGWIEHHRAAALAEGWIVAAHHDPTTRPVLRRTVGGHHWMQPGEHGWTPTTPPR